MLKTLFFKMEDIIMAHLADLKKNFYGYIRCRFILVVDNVTINFKQILMSTQTIVPNKTLVLLFSKVCQNNNQGHKFSHKTSLFITFTTRYLYMTDEFFLIQKSRCWSGLLERKKDIIY